MLKGRISEIFSSIQGEGIYQGEKQVFVRFFDCNLHCRFCDTPQEDFKEYSAEELFRQINALDKDCHSISFTGGEPLLQVDFLREIIFLCRQNNQKIYLETNGTLPDALEEIIDLVDIVAMDFKLPSSTGAGNFWFAHKEFLKIAGKKEVFVKAVICDSTEESDIKKAAEIIKSSGPQIPLILQPNFSEQGETLARKMEAYKKYCQQYLSDVRILPQLHKILSVK
jgi:7-carboxy-7-deazaguanine synthase